MGDVNRTIRTTWVGQGGNVLATIGRLNSELRGLGTSADQVNRRTGILGQQFRALGTTIRYALAGSVIFGSLRALSTLSEYQKKLGQIQAITDRPGPGGGTILGFDSRDLAKLNKDIQDVSVSTVSSLGDIQDSVLLIQSSFQNLPEERVMQFARLFNEAAQVTQASAEGASNAIIGMLGAFAPGQRGNLEQAQRMARIYTQLISVSAGIRGDVGANIVSQLSGSALQGGFSPEQMAGLLTTVSFAQAGAPRIAGLGLGQLMVNILRPKTAQEKQAYAEAGLPTDPNELAKMGGMKVLQQLMAAVRKRGGLRFTPGMTEEDVSAATTPEEVGVTGGGTALAYQFFGRVQALRQFAILMNAGTDAINKNVAEMHRGIPVHDRFMKIYQEETLARAAQSWATFSVSFVQTMSPVLNLMARLTETSTTFLRHNPRVAQGLAAGVLGLGVAGRFGLLGKVSRVLFGGRGLAGAARLEALPQQVPRALLEAEALPAALAGAGQGSRAAPFWVIIHPLSWALGAPGGGITDKGGGGGLPPAVVPWWRRGGRLGRFGLLRGGGAVAAMAMLAGNEISTGAGEADRRRSFADVIRMIRGNPRIFPRLSQTYPALEQGNLEGQAAAVWQMLAGGKIRPGQAERMLRANALGTQRFGHHAGFPGIFWQALTAGISRPQGQQATLKGKADVTVTVNIREASGRQTRKRVHVPVNMWPQFSGGRFPFQGGRPTGVSEK